MVQFGSNSRHTGIKFQSLETNLEWQRATVQNVVGTTIERCGFFGFLHVSALPNAWGLYLADAEDCRIVNCDFGNNSQSDIALVDNNRNITIIHPQNRVDSGGVYLNVEPNNTDGVIGLSIVGGRYRMVTLLENSFTAYAGKAISFNAATIDVLKYDGSGVSFDDACHIGSISNESNGIVYAGNLDLSLGLSRNLIDDPYLIDLAISNTSGQWTSRFISSSWAVDRVRDEFGSYVRLNKTNSNQVHSVWSKKINLITGTKPLLFMQIGRSNIPVGAAFIGNRTEVGYYNSSDVLLDTSRVVASRGNVGQTTEMQPHFAVLNPPAGTSYVLISLCVPVGVSTICDHIAAVGLWEIADATAKSVNTRAIATGLVGTPTITTRADQSPSTASHTGGFAGDRVMKLTPTAGQAKAWVCTVSGTPGTWVSEGNL
jgi:hypothetical protein